MREFIFCIVLAIVVYRACEEPSMSETKEGHSSSAAVELSPTRPELRYVDKLSWSCAEGEKACFAAIRHRTVSVHNDKGSGTGFILYANREEMIILTASHVIRDGNGKDSSIHPNLFIHDEVSDSFPDAVSACAFFKDGYADIALIKIKNVRDERIYIPELSYSGKRGDKRLVVERSDWKNAASWAYTVHSYNKQKNELIMGGTSTPGSSGSAVITYEGKLDAVLSKANKDLTIATYRISDAVTDGIDHLVEKESRYAPYICQTFGTVD